MLVETSIIHGNCALSRFARIEPDALASHIKAVAHMRCTTLNELSSFTYVLVDSHSKYGRRVANECHMINLFKNNSGG